MLPLVVLPEALFILDPLPFEPLSLIRLHCKHQRARDSIIHASKIRENYLFFFPLVPRPAKHDKKESGQVEKEKSPRKQATESDLQERNRNQNFVC